MEAICGRPRSQGGHNSKEGDDRPPSHGRVRLGEASSRNLGGSESGSFPVERIAQPAAGALSTVCVVVASIEAPKNPKRQQTPCDDTRKNRAPRENFPPV